MQNEFRISEKNIKRNITKLQCQMIKTVPFKLKLSSFLIIKNITACTVGKLYCTQQCTWYSSFVSFQHLNAISKPNLHPSYLEALLSWIPTFLHPCFPASLLSCIPTFLHPSFPASLHSSTPHFQPFYCTKSLLLWTLLSCTTKVLNFSFHVPLFLYPSSPESLQS